MTSEEKNLLAEAHRLNYRLRSTLILNENATKYKEFVQEIFSFI